MRDEVEGRIEIELVEHAPDTRQRRGGRAAREPHAVAVAPSVSDPPVAAAIDPGSDAPGGRRRLAGIVAGVGTAGLLVGWLAGRSGEGGVAVSPQNTPAPGTTAVAPSFPDDPALVEPAVPTTVRPRPRQTTTSVAEPDVVSVAPIPDLDARLVGLPYEIVVDDGRGSLRYLDLAGDEMTTVRLGRSTDTGRLFVGDSWVLAPNGSTIVQRLVHDGAAEAEALNADVWSMLHAPGAATLWRYDTQLAAGQAGEMIEIDTTGAPTGAAVAMPVQPMMIDSTGTFVVRAPGGIYTVSGSETTRITSGEIAAWGRNTVLVVECDATLQCQHIVVHRDNGARRVLPARLADAQLNSFGWWGELGEGVSPDGMLAIVNLLTPAPNGTDLWPTPHLVDLVAGTSRPLGDDANSFTQNVRWTGDSQFAFFLDQGVLHVWSRADDENFRVSTGWSSVSRAQAFGIRPSDGTPWVDR